MSHSGWHVSIRYSERLAEAGIAPSVGSKGDSYDNALAETINGLYKAELIHRRASWKTKEAPWLQIRSAARYCWHQGDKIARALPHPGADGIEPLPARRGDHRGAVSLGRMAR